MYSQLELFSVTLKDRWVLTEKYLETKFNINSSFFFLSRFYYNIA